MIVVTDAEGVDTEFPSASRASTDEFNNLCIWEGVTNERLVHLYRCECWREMKVDE